MTTRARESIKFVSRAFQGVSRPLRLGPLSLLLMLPPPPPALATSPSHVFLNAASSLSRRSIPSACALNVSSVALTNASHARSRA